MPRTVGVSKLTQEWIIKTLESLGFKQIDAEIYVSLTKNNSQKADDVATTLKTYKLKVYRSLKTLQAKGVVEASPERPAQFSAVPFEKILEALITANLKETKRLEQEKEEILSRWRMLITESSTAKI